MEFSAKALLFHFASMTVGDKVVTHVSSLYISVSKSSENFKTVKKNGVHAMDALQIKNSCKRIRRKPKAYI